MWSSSGYGTVVARLMNPALATTRRTMRRDRLNNFGDYARFHAASHANFSEVIDHSRRQISAMLNNLPSLRAENADEEAMELPKPSVQDLLNGFDAGAQRTRLLGSISAAQAVALDHMQANGGPDNPEAYADYGAATAFHTALMGDTPGTENNSTTGIPTQE